MCPVGESCSMEQTCPRHLYKYRQIGSRFKGRDGKLRRVLSESTRSLIQGLQLWFATPDTLNDPYDCRAYYTLEYTESQIAEQALELERRFGQETRDDFLTAMADPSQVASSQDQMQAFNDRIAERFGVCCFSASPTVAKMWAHYADSHRGICVEIDTLALPTGNRGKIFKVRYSAVRPVVSVGYSFERSREIVTTKSEDWAEEQEWRALLQPNFACSIPQEAISAIIFGARIDPEDEVAVGRMLGSRTVPVALRRARLADREYRIDVVDA
jgi:hypothetical protein